MPSFQHGSNASSPSSSIGLRAGAGLVVLALHAAVVGAIFMAPPEAPKLEQPETIMVSVIEAPVAQVAKAEEPAPEAPQPVVEPPPEPQAEPEPETKPDPEPEPEPEPVVEKPPMPAPKPKPKPKPKPQPKQEAPKQEPKPDTPPTQPTGAPEGSQATQSPQQGPPPDQPELVSSVEYLGAKPSANYPMASRRMREEGRVVVLVEINNQGLVVSARVDSSSGSPRLDEAALAAIRKARFKPYTRNGVAYAAKAKIPFDFVMRN